MSIPENTPLDLARKLYQRSIRSDVLTVSRNCQLNRPLVVELDPTSFCDLACPECISGALLNQSRFTKERLTELANEMVEIGIRAVVLIGGGEPLMHSGIGGVIRTLGEGGISVGVTTNGTMLHRYVDVLAEFVSWTRVSVDAGSEQCYSTFRPSRSGRNAFHSVIRSMRILAQKKRGLLGYSYLLIARDRGEHNQIEHNFAEVLTAGLLAKEIGCDYFEIKPSYDLKHYLIKQADELLESLEYQLHALAQVTNERFVVVAPGSLDAVLQRRAPIEHKAYGRCKVAELRTLISSQGAFVCPYHRGDSARKYGDPTTSSLYSLWNSALRSQVMANTIPSRDCTFHCIRHSSNLELIRIGEGNAAMDLIDDYDFFV